MRLGRFVAWCALLGLLVGPVPAGRSPAAAYPSANVDLAGHGFGHGRGLGQYGSLGYALEGWDHKRILAHYYSNTDEGSLGGSPELRVRLTRLDGKDTIVQQERGRMISNVVPGEHRALRAVRIGPNLFRVDKADDCAGGPIGWQVAVASASGPVTFVPIDRTDDHRDMIQVCEAAANRWYRGQVESHESDGTVVTVNNVDMEGYLRGVVPRESPASWADLGGGRGINALRAQAVAARSYAWSENRSASGVFKTCDTTSCQVYLGRAEQLAGQSFKTLEDPRSDRAIADTASQIRLLNGVVARTEFSSSTGGYTAGGTFPSVRDDGDAVAQNPNHNWTASIPVATIEARFNMGRLDDVVVLRRNGIGDMGGRVLDMRLVFSGGALDLTGDRFRIEFGLKSNWFSVVNLPAHPYHVVTRNGDVFAFGGAPALGSLRDGGVTSPARDMAEGPGGYWVTTESADIYGFGVPVYGSMGGKRLNAAVVGLATTASGQGYWQVAGDGGIFTFGDAPFHGSTGGMRLNQPVVGMAPTSSGDGYWVVATDGGIFTFGDAPFHGSTGAMRLNQPVFGMGSTPSGRGYWLVARDGGVFTFGDAPYLGSLPERSIRETAVELLPTASGSGYLIVTSEGRVHAFGDARAAGGPRDRGSTSPAVGAGRPR